MLMQLFNFPLPRAGNKICERKIWFVLYRKNVMEGTIIKILRERGNNNKKVRELTEFIDRVEPDIEKHLQQINNFLPEFDSHNIEHCQAVLKNMEMILDDKITQISTIELFLLYMTALLHDCGMALSKQEYNILIACEGEEKDLNIPKFGLDGKKRTSLKQMKEMIRSCREKLYGELITSNRYVQGFIFGFQDEDKFIEHLANLAIQYQIFRNGRLPQLKTYISNTSFDQINILARKEFIRNNHAIQSKIYCLNLADKFENQVIQDYGVLFSKIIGELCFSHGINFDDSQKSLLNLAKKYFDNEKADLLFVAAMLRVADALHFGMDRVNKSLSFEKGTNNNIHWKVKLTGFGFKIENKDGVVEISANGPFSKPEEYYFLKDYIKYVDDEVLNLKKSAKIKQLEIKICDKIDSDGVVSISDDFIPADDLCIKMDQSNIIGLLMSEELYKEKYACIRELYQNSLDACRCKQLKSSDFVGNIEFGIDICSKHSMQRKYLYCVDNGIGMDMLVIKKYLLHIGHTFYSSAEFYQMCSESPNKFYPISQFGVGILSCFMLCDLIEITTMKENSAPVCLTIDGKNEYLYFSKPNLEDIERFENSGTIVKLFLKDIDISDEMPKKEILNEILMRQSAIERDYSYVYECDSFLDLRLLPMKKNVKYCKMIKCEESCLFTILTKYIKLRPRNINVIVRCAGKFINHATQEYDSYKLVNLNTCELIKIKYNQIIDKYSIIYKESNHVYKSLYLDNIDRKEIVINSQNLQYRNLLYFPKNFFETINSESLLFNRMFEFHKTGFLVDGIAVNFNENLEFAEKYDGEFTLNFIGEIRPQLSIDRRNILSIPNQLENEMEKLLIEVAKEEIDCICKYLENIPENHKKNISDVMWIYYFTSRRFLYPQIVNYLWKNPHNVCWCELSNYLINNISLSDFLSKTSIRIKSNINYLTTTNFFKTILAHKIALSEKIDLHQNEIVLRSSKFKINKDILTNNHGSYRNKVYRRVDFSKTAYHQYDVVNSLLPMLNCDFFDLLAENNKTCVKGDVIVGEEINDNDIRFLYNVDSLSVFNNVIYIRYHPNEYSLKYLSNCKFINGPSLSRRISQKRAYFIYAFITSNLTTEQKEYIESFRDINPDYYIGAIEGWSILYTEDLEIVALPGIHNIEELLVRISDSYWTNCERKSYLSNNTEITFETIRQLRKELRYN